MAERRDAVCTRARMENRMHVLDFEVEDPGDGPETFRTQVPDNEYHLLRKHSDGSHFKANEKIGWVPVVYEDGGWQIDQEELKGYSYDG